MPKTKSSKSSARVTKKILTLGEMRMEDVWRRYRSEGGHEVRNFLVEKFQHLVRYNAERLHKKLPDEVDVNDLGQAGMFGLMDAIDTYDLERGVKFETFCARRILGAMLDELRSMDVIPRLVRHRTAKVETARKAFAAVHGREPTEQELAQHLGMGMDVLQKYLKDSRPASFVSLNRKCFEGDSSRDVREIDILEDETQSNPFDVTQRGDLKEVITKGLTRAERLIVVLYYYEEMTMKEIGMTLDLSESRVSQMHSSILARLRAHLLHREAELSEA